MAGRPKVLTCECLELEPVLFPSTAPQMSGWANKKWDTTRPWWGTQGQKVLIWAHILTAQPFFLISSWRNSQIFKRKWFIFYSTSIPPKGKARNNKKPPHLLSKKPQEMRILSHFTHIMLCYVTCFITSLLRLHFITRDNKNEETQKLLLLFLSAHWPNSGWLKSVWKQLLVVQTSLISETFTCCISAQRARLETHMCGKQR